MKKSLSYMSSEKGGTEIPRVAYGVPVTIKDLVTCKDWLIKQGRGKVTVLQIDSPGRQIKRK